MRPASIFATAEAAEDAFYDAMQRGDLEAMMNVWADDEDVVCIHPGGDRLVGLRAIRDGFASIFADGGLDVRPSDARIHLGGALAVHTLTEKVLVSSGKGSEVVQCAATNVYVKGVAGWRIVVHHAGPGGNTASPAPVDAPSVLH